MAILWRDEMSVGDELIDSDHRYLICMINTVELAMVSKKPNNILMVALDQLSYYTQMHFNREEVLQEQTNYPQYSNHKKSHKDLVTQLNGIKNKISELSVNSDHYNDKVSNLVVFLRNWLLDHVIKEDLLMKPYILKYRK